MEMKKKLLILEVQEKNKRLGPREKFREFAAIRVPKLLRALKMSKTYPQFTTKKLKLAIHILILKERKF